MIDTYQSPLANSFETQVGAIVESVSRPDRAEFFMQAGLDIGLRVDPSGRHKFVIIDPAMITRRI